MKATKKTRHLSPVVIACITAAAASFAFGSALAPAWAQVDQANPTNSTTSISSPAPLPDVPEQMAAAATDIILPAYFDRSVIGDNVMAGASGAMAVNQAAGDMNQQINATAIAYNPPGAASAQTDILQGAKNVRGTLPTEATTRIEGGAFANTSGVLGVNQASGFANGQANSTAIAVGVSGEVIADSVLAETFTSAAGMVKTAQDPASSREVSVSETAFQNAQGVVQLNQTAGAGNNSANSFALRLSVEPKQ